MSVRKLTQAEAKIMLADTSVARPPRCILNATGQEAVAQWVKLTGKDVEFQLSMLGWYMKAIAAAEKAIQRNEDIVIEMAGNRTACGSPRTTHLDPEGFDWVIDN